MMSQEVEYFATLEYNNFQSLVNTQLYLTKEEYDFVVSYDPDERNNFSYIGDYSKLGDYLNLNVYSEVEHHDRTYKIECGL